ncbi:hypothetical protein GCM10009836_41150 [Pseudonocardia ailaonensis]|uniref:HTH luxR-type domain-containing protein n=1 Tax=Pseudonocardia ailaonensis TaxID=367279 RepID=A0ABN2N8P7_9PSEU
MPLWRDAGRPADAAALALRLARRDAARGALRTADALLEDALLRSPDVPDVLRERVRILTLVGRAQEALDLGAAALDGLAGDAHADLCLELARTAVAAARWGDATRFVERAGRPADPRSAVLLADAAFGEGRVDDAAALAARAVVAAERAGEPAALCEALGVVARTSWRVDLAATEAAFRRAAQVAAEHGLTPWRVTALAGAGMMEALDPGDAPTLELARTLARDTGMLGQLAASDLIVADVVLLRDGPEAATPHALRALESARTLRLPGVADAAAGQAATCRAGAADRAGCERLIAEMRDPNLGLRALGAFALGLSSLVEHDLRSAAACFDPVVDLVLEHRATPLLAPVGAWLLVRTALDGQDGARARLTEHPKGMTTPNRAAVRYADAVTAGRAGRGAEAVAALAEADALLAARPWWRRLLRLTVLDSAVRDGWGDPVPELRADLAAHEAAGAVHQARTCRDLLRAAGAPARRATGAPVAPHLRALGVTGREAEVLALVARGMTNAQIAERLVLSRRTVETHVANLLAKSGAPGRRELGALAAEPP